MALPGWESRAPPQQERRAVSLPGGHSRCLRWGFQVRISSRCSVRSRSSPRTQEGCLVRSQRRDPGTQEKQIPLKARSGTDGVCEEEEEEECDRGPSATENFSTAETCPGTMLGTDGFHLHGPPRVPSRRGSCPTPPF